MNTPETEKLLRHQYRWMQLGWPLVILCAGLAATLAVDWMLYPSTDRIEKWHHLPIWWTGGLAITLAGALCFWITRRRGTTQYARKLDATLDAKNRLETAASLDGDPSLMARVQREETAEFLSHAPVKPCGNLLGALVAVLAVLVFAHLVTLLSWTRPWVRPVVEAPKPPPAEALPKATIVWKTPESETKASPIEEVPLKAVATSTTGLRDLVLEMEVNGVPRLKTPISLAELSEKGSHAIDTSVYLDQLEVEPFDIVSYYLHARRIDSRDLPETASPVQFVQVKPFREDVAERQGGSGESKAAQALIAALKIGQLRLIKENFYLTHAEIAHESPEWQKENKRVADNQATLETKTGEAIEKLIETGAPAEIVNLITQTRPLMKEASQKIAASLNPSALPPQGKALGLITEVEKFLVKVIAQGKGKPKPAGPEDPFKKKQDLELKQRIETKAGELELLAREQARLADDLAKANPSMPEAPVAPNAAEKKDSNRIDGTLPERQVQISQRVGALINGRIFVPDVTSHLTQAHEEALNSVRLLDATDVSGAREPAASTARELRLALNEMNKQGEQEAKEQLAQTMKELQDAANAAQSAPKQSSDDAAKQQAAKASDEAQKAASELAKAAQKQQESGSAPAATQMSELAKAVNDEALKKKIEQMQKAPRDTGMAQEVADHLEKLADRAGREANRGKPSPEQLAKLIEQMDRTRANLERLAKSQEPGNAKASTAGKESASPSPGGSKPESPSPGKEGSSPAGPQPGSPSPGKAGSSRGEAKGESPGKGSSPGEAKGESPGQGSSRGEAKSGSPGQGSGSADGGTEAGTPGSSAQQQFAEQLMQELRQEAYAAENVTPSASGLRDALRSLPHETNSPLGNIGETYSLIEKPLQGTIDLLRNELLTLRRQYQLAGSEPSQAPEAYRPAVAEYFEMLSLDYQTTPPPKEEPAP